MNIEKTEKTFTFGVSMFVYEEMLLLLEQDSISTFVRNAVQSYFDNDCEPARKYPPHAPLDKQLSVRMPMNLVAKIKTQVEGPVKAIDVIREAIYAHLYANH